ncbi:hypothetical protein Ancab_023966 [Ancistrocladus abbreviatus]
MDCPKLNPARLWRSGSSQLLRRQDGCPAGTQMTRPSLVLLGVTGATQNRFGFFQQNDVRNIPEDRKVNRHPTSFETRLETALQKNTAET